MRFRAKLGWMLAAWALYAGHAHAVRSIPNLPYVEHADTRQHVDLTLPDSPGFPTLVFVHGGSLNSGDRAEPVYVQMGNAFASAGLGFASVGYRLFPDHPWPAPIEDVASAVAWVRNHVESYGGRADRIYLVGHSSGARLVELLAADPSHLAHHQLRPGELAGVVGMGAITHDVEFEAQVTQVPSQRVRQAFVADPDLRMFGNEATYRASWPLAHANRDMPPILILVAEKEREQPPCWSTGQEFAAAAAKAGAWCRVEELRGRSHTTTIEWMSRPGDASFQRIVAFVREAPHLVHGSR